MHTLKISEAN